MNTFERIRLPPFLEKRELFLFLKLYGVSRVTQTKYLMSLNNGFLNEQKRTCRV